MVNYIKKVTKELSTYFKDPQNPTVDEIKNVMDEICKIANNSNPIMISKCHIIIDEFTERPIDVVFLHELGGALGAINEPLKFWVYDVFMRQVYPKWDTEGGHHPADHPHNTGSKKGESEF